MCKGISSLGEVEAQIAGEIGKMLRSGQIGINEAGNKNAKATHEPRPLVHIVKMHY